MKTTDTIVRWLPAAVAVAALALAAILYGDILRNWFLGADEPPRTAGTTEIAENDDPDAIAYWSCAMHPSVRSEVPGTCPICSMDLTPVTRGEIETGVITVDAARRQTIGVKTDTVRREPIIKDIRAVGTIEADETRLHDVTLKVDAWIGDVHADFEGKTVEPGEVLFTYYSPDLWAAQEEYLEARRRTSGDAARADRFAGIAETRLRLLGLDATTIASVRENGEPLEYLPYRSPAPGTVIHKNIVAGSAVDSGEMLYRIADLSTVWVEVDVYENDLAWVQVGQLAHLTVTNVPESTFSGRVEFVYPTVDASTQTGRVRISAPNPTGTLMPGMYADATMVKPLGERLVVPQSAILYAGKSRIAFVDLGEGRLQPRKVTVGVRSADLVEIRDGLVAGETVVTSGNFLIAAESKLKSGIDQW